jgi:uncharacterized membrane protein YhaH (DUF805 family)
MRAVFLIASAYMETNPYQTPVAGPQPPAFVPPPGPPRLGIKQILFSFQGRIPRRTFWLWRIVTVMVLVVLFSLIAPLLTVGVDQTAEEPGLNPIAPILMVILFIPFVWISLALLVKRWHDRDKSGAWVLINLVPLVGPIWSFVECGCLRGSVGHNNFGSDPT